MGALQRRRLGARPLLRMDMGGCGAMGLGTLSLRPVGLCAWILVLGARAVVLPAGVNGLEGTESYEKLIDTILNRLLAASGVAGG